MFMLPFLVGVLFSAAAALLYVNYLNGRHAEALTAAEQAAQLREQIARDAGYLDGATNYQAARLI